MTSGGDTLYFRYDSLGPMSVNYNGTEYFYMRDAQGNIIAIVDASGSAVVEYTYDAWGNAVSTTGSMANTLGMQNPFRYRGYVYDTETGLYYLQTRYYDPAIGRFICADGYASTGVGLLGTNAFAYCNNNPTTLKDSGGTRPVDCVRLTEEMHKKESIAATKKEVQRQNDIYHNRIHTEVINKEITNTAHVKTIVTKVTYIPKGAAKDYYIELLEEYAEPNYPEVLSGVVLSGFLLTKTAVRVCGSALPVLNIASWIWDLYTIIESASEYNMLQQYKRAMNKGMGVMIIEEEIEGARCGNSTIIIYQPWNTGEYYD